MIYLWSCANKGVFLDGIRLHLSARVNVQCKEAEQLTTVLATHKIGDARAVQYDELEKGIRARVEVWLELDRSASNLFC